MSSFYTNPLDTSYGASKAAAWSMTNGIRTELAHQGTLVLAVHASFIDTDMAAGIEADKVSAESVARQTFDAVAAGRVEVLADERSRFVTASLSRDHELLYPEVQSFWGSLMQGGSVGGVRATQPGRSTSGFTDHLVSSTRRTLFHPFGVRTMSWK